MSQVYALPRSPAMPRAVRPRRASIPLPPAVAEQVNTCFYAPVLSAINLAESLLRAAKTDAAQIKSPEWRVALQQAMNQIRASCDALLDISSSEAARESFPPILAAVDELQRFLRLAAPLLSDMEPEAQRRQLELSGSALAQTTRALKEIYRTILHPTGRKAAAQKQSPRRAPRHLSAAPEKSDHRPGWLETLVPGRNREKAESASLASAPAAPLTTSAAAEGTPPPAVLPPSNTELPSRRMTDGLGPVSNSGQWIEKAIRDDTSAIPESARRDYIADLYLFNAWRRERPFTRALIEEYTATLERTGYSPDAIARTLEVLRWLAGRSAEWAVETNHLDAADQQNILIEAAQVLGFRQARVAGPAQEPSIAKAELAALLSHCAQDASCQSARDAAIIALAWSAGLAPSQLARLKVTSIQCDRGEVSLTVRRGSKDESIPLPEPATQAVLKWLSLRRYNLGPLFYAVNRQGNVRWGQGMSEEAIAEAIKTRMAAAQIASAIQPDP